MRRRRVEVVRMPPFAAVCLALALSWTGPGPAAAHPGGLAADGCHNDRRNGGRHCHRGSSARSAPTALRAARGTYYANCSEARAAGAVPVRRGDPGYAAHLDRDNDGIGCE